MKTTNAVIISLIFVSINAIAEESNNLPPVSVAGSPHYVLGGDKVNLDGSASYDLDGEIVSYLWKLKVGNNKWESVKKIKIDNADTAIATIKAPSCMRDNRIRFTLTVTDNEGATDTSYTFVYSDCKDKGRGTWD